MYKKSFLTLAALLVFLFAYAYLVNAQQETLPGTPVDPNRTAFASMWVWRLKIRDLIDSGDYAAAESLIEQMKVNFARSEELGDNLLHFAWRCEQQGQKNLARELYQDVSQNYSKIDPYQAAFASMWVSRFNIYDLIDAGDYAAAESLIEQMKVNFAGNTELADHLYNIAWKYHENDRRDLARVLYQDVSQNYSDIDPYRAALASMWVSRLKICDLIDAGDYAAAESSVNQMKVDFARSEDLADHLLHFAWRCEQQGQRNLARVLYQDVSQNYSEIAPYRAGLASMWVSKLKICDLIDAGDYAAAEPLIEQMKVNFAGSEDLANVLHDMAYKYRQSQENARADELDQYVLSHWPSTEIASWSQQVEIIKSYLRDANDAAADAASNKLLAAFSQQPTLLKEIYQVASAYDRAGRYDKAGQLYQYVIDNQSNTEDAIWAKASTAKLNILLGNEATVKAALDILVADFNYQQDLPRAILFAGEQYYKEGLSKESEGLADQARDRFEKAVEIWDRLINELPDSTLVAEACCWAGDCYFKLGKHEESIRRFQKVVDNYPGYEHAWHALFMVGCNYESMKNSGLISKSQADPKIKAAYTRLLEKYPTCPAAQGAREWMDSNNSK